MLGLIIAHSLSISPTNVKEFGTSIFLRTSFVSVAYLSLLKIIVATKKQWILDSLAQDLMEGKTLSSITYSNGFIKKFDSLKGIGHAITAIFILAVVGTTIQTIYSSLNKEKYRI
ncbi:MAG: hypothetical protein Q8K60_02730 [Parachlamydiaceae bacterium]|nr:hypothetical protein [Parachlamydiaceae bacterium]